MFRTRLLSLLPLLLLLSGQVLLASQAQARYHNPESDGVCLTLAQARATAPAVHLRWRPARSRQHCWYAPGSPAAQQVAAVEPAPARKQLKKQRKPAYRYRVEDKATPPPAGKPVWHLASATTTDPVFALPPLPTAPPPDDEEAATLMAIEYLCGLECALRAQFEGRFKGR